MLTELTMPKCSGPALYVNQYRHVGFTPWVPSWWGPSGLLTEWLTEVFPLTREETFTKAVVLFN